MCHTRLLKTLVSVCDTTHSHLPQQLPQLSISDHSLFFFYVLLAERLMDDTFIPEKSKRRHARPHELDSDDDGEDKGREEYNTLQNEEISQNAEPVERANEPQILVKKIIFHENSEIAKPMIAVSLCCFKKIFNTLYVLYVYLLA